jgi:hypothetical protein
MVEDVLHEGPHQLVMVHPEELSLHFVGEVTATTDKQVKG